MLGKLIGLPRLGRGVYDHFAIMRKALANVIVNGVRDYNFIKHIFYDGESLGASRLFFRYPKQAHQSEYSFQCFA